MRQFLIFSVSCFLAIVPLVTAQAQWEWEFFDWRPEDYDFPKIFAEQLTEANFKSKLMGWVSADKQYSVIDFYAPWCPHCQHFAPHYERVAEAFNNRSKLEVATVDCTTERQLCSLFNIRYYPSLLYTSTQGWLDAYADAKALKLTDLKSAGITDLLYDVKLDHTAAALGNWLSEAIGDHTGPRQSDRSALFTVGHFSNEMRNEYAASGSFRKEGAWLSEGPRRDESVDYWDVLVAAALSLHYAFEVQTGDPQMRESLEDWVEVLCHNFPVRSLRPRLCELRVSKMSHFLNVSGTQASDAMEHGWHFGMDPAAVRKGSPAYELPWMSFKHGWRSCRGTWPGTRGYTCGLWLLFHSLVMAADTDNDAVDTLLRIRTYVKDYFGCKDCQENFLKQRVEPCTFQLSSDKANKWLRTSNSGVGHGEGQSLEWTDPNSQAGTWFKLALEELRTDTRKVFKIKMAFPLGGEFDNVEVPLYLSVGSKKQLQWTQYEVQASVFAMAPAVIADSWGGYEDGHDMSVVDPNQFRLMYMATFQNVIEDGAFLSKKLTPTRNPMEAAVMEMTCYDGEPAQPFMTGVKTQRDVHLWLWRAHNEVNQMVSGMATQAARDGYVYSDPEFPHPQWPNISSKLCSGCAAVSETNAGNQEVAGKGFSHSWDLEYVWKYLHHYYQSTMYFAPPFTDRHESEETAVQQIAKRVRRKKVGGSTSTAHSSHNSHPAPAPHSSSSSSSSGSTHGHSTTSHGSGTPASQPAKPSSSSTAPAGAARPAPVQLPDHSKSQAATHAATPARLPHVGEKGFTPAGWAVKGQERNQQSMAAVYLGDSAVLATMVCVVGLLGGAVYTAINREWIPNFGAALELRPLKATEGAFGSGGL